MNDFLNSLAYYEIVGLVKGRKEIKKQLKKALKSAVIKVEKETITADEIAELVLHLRKYAGMYDEGVNKFRLRLNKIKDRERLKCERILECKNTK